MILTLADQSIRPVARLTCRTGIGIIRTFIAPDPTIIAHTLSYCTYNTGIYQLVYNKYIYSTVPDLQVVHLLALAEHTTHRVQHAAAQSLSMHYLTVHWTITIYIYKRDDHIFKD